MGFKVGEQDTIRCIADISLQGSDGKALCLAHKFHTYWLGLGAWVTDDGYVLREKDNENSFYDWPKPEVISTYQQEGSLPKTLPPYEITPLDYALGYSLWLTLAGVLIYQMLFAKKKEQAELPEIPTPTPMK